MVTRTILTGEVIASVIIGVIFLLPVVYAAEDNSVRVPFTEIIPVIDGKFTSDAEWANANVVSFNSNGHEFYLLTKQNMDFVYLMFDGIDFQIDPKRSDLSVRYQAVLCFDGNNDKGIKRGLGDFCHTSTVFNEFGRQTRGENAPIKFDSDGESSHLDLPNNFQTGWGYDDSQNDPFEESDHLMFEVQLPRTLFESPDDVGFTFQMYAGSSSNDVVQLIDGVNWPPESDKKIPSTWATLILPEIQCPENLKLIFKASDNSPACVKEESVVKLIERKWGLAENSATKIDTFKETIRKKVDDGTYQSLFVGVINKDGTEQYHYGQTAKDGKPIDENIIFDTGSISKVFTSLILADMVVNEEVNLDDPIDKFLPENVQTPSFGGKKITLWDLATHTSGLPVMPNYPPNPDLDKEYDYSKDGMYEYLSDYTISREIGSQYEYSNTGGSLLGHVLSLQSGKSYEQTLKERILDKLGMDSTCVNQCDELRDRFAKPHALGELADETIFDDEMAGAGGVRSSGKDMLAFLSYAMDFEDSELQSAFELSQTTNHKMNEVMSMGLGWHIVDNDERNIIWHNGATKGFASFVGFDSESNEGVVVLTNSQALVDEIGWDVLDFRFEE